MTIPESKKKIKHLTLDALISSALAGLGIGFAANGINEQNWVDVLMGAVLGYLMGSNSYNHYKKIKKERLFQQSLENIAKSMMDLYENKVLFEVEYARQQINKAEQHLGNPELSDLTPNKLVERFIHYANQFASHKERDIEEAMKYFAAMEIAYQGIGIMEQKTYGLIAKKEIVAPRDKIKKQMETLNVMMRELSAELNLVYGYEPKINYD